MNGFLLLTKNGLQATLPIYVPHLDLSTIFYSLQKKVVKKLFDKLNDVQFKYRFVDCFCNVLKFGLNGSVFATKGQSLDLLQKLLNRLNFQWN